MNKICFVCLGNICRSPMAEYILKDKLEKNNIKDYIVESRATSYEEQGNSIYYKAKSELERHSITNINHKAKRLEKEDLDYFDIFYYMDDSNLINIKRILGESNKYKKLQEYDIEDPWYTNNFSKVYNEIENACDKIIQKKTN